MNPQTTTHTLRAWVQPRDFVPTLYIEGEIPTNGERPLVGLVRADPQGRAPKDLSLAFTVDVYDPKGEQRLIITRFADPIARLDEFRSVTIRANNGDIHLPVEEREPASATT